MCNNAWRRLCNEWTFNAINDEFQALCRRIDADNVDALHSHEMQWVRKECKKSYVWLEDTCEEDLYLAFMPFGGYTRQALAELKAALKEYRSSGHSSRVYRDIIARKEALCFTHI